jgi:hypothetical protein
VLLAHVSPALPEAVSYATEGPVGAGGLTVSTLVAVQGVQAKETFAVPVS